MLCCLIIVYWHDSTSVLTLHVHIMLADLFIGMSWAYTAFRLFLLFSSLVVYGLSLFFQKDKQ
jgi:hypothetical protein